MRSALALCAGAFCLSGCFSGSGNGPSPEEKAAFEKKTGSDPVRAKAFVKAVEALPLDQRRAYLDQHPDEVRNMALLPEPALQDKFRKLMTGRG